MNIAEPIGDPFEDGDFRELGVFERAIDLPS